MDNQDRIDQDPNDGAAARPEFHVLAPDDLASFASEGVGAVPPPVTDWSTQSLADFPAEAVASVPITTPTAPAFRAFSTVALGVVLIAAFAGGWWAARLPWRQPAMTIATTTTPPSPRPAEAARSVQPQVSPPIEPKIIDYAPAVEPTPVPAVAVAKTEAVAPAREPSAPTVASLPPAATTRAPIEPPRGEQTRTGPLGTSGATARESNPGLRTRPPTESAAIVETRLPALVMPSSAPMRATAVESPQVAAGRPPEPAPARADVSTPTPTPAPVPPAPEAFAGAAVVRSEQSEIQRALGQYRNAYERLDAGAARSVWPSVDVQALGRAFSGLTSQQLAFDSCLFDIAGDNATAHCTGSATYTPKVGGRGPRSELRQWTFQLRKAPDGWKIQSAQIRRDD